jgi:GNAT superfamily N-acetyltransferase
VTLTQSNTPRRGALAPLDVRTLEESVLEDLTPRSVADDASFINPIEDLVELVWPAFIRYSHPAPDAQYHGDYMGLYDRWPDHQYAMLDAKGGVVAAVHCCPLAWDGDESALPDDGWDWELETAADDLAAGRPPRTLGAVSITIHPDLRGRHFSPQLLLFMREIGKRSGFKRLIAPVRPTQKAEQPFLSIDEYIRQTTPEGLARDAWLRTHQRLGARIVRPCRRSMQIVGTPDEWRAWTGQAFSTSGEHAFPGGLAPLQVDLAANHCLYVEPNVWMVHDIA